ncbi:MAG: biotin--[acetyl-CoA-carboxylase] ligase [Alphaproteobacteria bacterium]|nr:biotin--[acetyl-CoA-carboxylase] ligase [Alphaproteobacteria bacterium]
MTAFDSLDGTNAEALRRLAAGARGIEVIWAREQTAGRGRDGRSWSSPLGNLYVSFLAEAPRGRPPAEIAFVAAVAAGEAILGCGAAGVDLRYKWPNDLLVAGRKAGGILIEGDGSGGLAIGIGINVESAPAVASWPATCLHDEGAAGTTVEVLRDSLIAAFLASFARWRREGFSPVREAWQARAYGIGEAMRARLPDGSVFDGVFVALGDDGALLLDQGPQGVRRIAAGEIMPMAG